MMRPRTIRRGAWIAAALSTLVAAGMVFVSPSGHAAALAPTRPDTFSSTVIALDPGIAEEIVLANVFAVTRTAPGTRYSPGEVAGAVDPGPMSFVEASGDASDVADEPRLLGTVIAPAGPRALLQLDPAGARLYAEGEEDAGYRIVSITPRVVVLRRQGGARVTLRLDPQEDRP